MVQGEGLHAQRHRRGLRRRRQRRLGGTTTDIDFDQAIFLDDGGFIWKGRRYAPISGGAPDEADPPAGDGTGAEGTPPDGTPAATGDGSGSGGAGDGGGSAGKTFTQEEVNALMARETAKAARGKLDPKELGFDSAKEAKEFLDAAKAKADADKSEADKALEEATTKAKEDAEKGVLARANNRLIQAEFKVQAKDAGVVALDDALTLAKTMEIWAQVEVVEEGENVKIEGFDTKFFEELKKAKPFLFAGAAGTTGDIGAGAGGGNGKAPNPNSDDELRKRYSALP